MELRDALDGKVRSTCCGVVRWQQDIQWDRTNVLQ